MGLSASQARLLTLTSRLSDLELRAQNISNAKVRLSDESEAASKAYSDSLDKQILKVYTGIQSDGSTTYANATLKNITTYGTVSNTDKFRYVKTTSGKVLVTKELASYLDLNGSQFTTKSDSYYNHEIQPLDVFLSNCQTGGLIADKTDQSANDVIYYTKIWNEVTLNGTVDSQGYIVGNYTTPDGTVPTLDSSTQNENSSEWLQGQIDAGNVLLYEWDDKGGDSGTGDYTSTSWTSGDMTLTEDVDERGAAKAEALYETTMASIESKDKRFDIQLKTAETEHSSVQTEIESVKKVINKNIERTLKYFDA